MASGVTTFNIRISRTSRLYYTVKVFKTAAEMRNFAAKAAGGGVSYYSSAHGACIYYDEKPKNLKTANKLGYISLWEGSLSLEIVSHECVHAALGALHRKNVPSLETGDIGSDKAEELCYIQGFLLSQIAKKLYKIH